MDWSTYKPSPLAEVGCHASGDRWTLVFIRDLPHRPEKVWAALTEPEELNEWAPYLADRNLGTVGDATLTMVDGDKAEELQATVTLAEPPMLLEYTWGHDLVRWKLTPTPTGTRLILSHTLEDREWAPKVAAGWHICLDVAELLLDGNPIGPVRGEDARNYGWDELNDAYAEKLA